MTLSSALNSVQSIFNTTAKQSSIVSTNIANVASLSPVSRSRTDWARSSRVRSKARMSISPVS